MSAPVETYRMRVSISRELATRHRAEAEQMLRSDIEGKVRREGYEPLADQFSCDFVSPQEMALDPMSYGDEFSVDARDRDHFVATAQIRCYRLRDASV